MIRASYEKREFRGSRSVKAAELRQWFGRELSAEEQAMIKDGLQIWAKPVYLTNAESDAPSAVRLGRDPLGEESTNHER